MPESAVSQSEPAASRNSMASRSRSRSIRRKTIAPMTPSSPSLTADGEARGQHLKRHAGGEQCQDQVDVVHYS